MACVMSAGHAITGFCVSLTVTVKLHVAPWTAVQSTGVVPTGKNEPGAGLQLTVPQPWNLPGALPE